jgi:hypothetical protein
MELAAGSRDDMEQLSSATVERYFQHPIIST